MILTEIDNQIIINHIYNYNKNVDYKNKIVMDCIITDIVIKDDDTIFNYVKVDAILDDECGVTEDVVSKAKDIGSSGTINLSKLDDDLKGLMISALREININKLLT